MWKNDYPKFPIELNHLNIFKYLNFSIFPKKNKYVIFNRII